MNSGTPVHQNTRTPDCFLSGVLVMGALVLLLTVIFPGCTSSQNGNIGNLQSYSTPVKEADWIRNGQPLEFEGEMWYPQDGIESLLDAEVLLLGEYQGVQIFVDKQDVRPFNRLYTKFNKNQFRYFEKQKQKTS